MAVLTGGLLAHSIFLNGILASKTTPIIAAFISHSVGLAFLMVVIVLSRNLNVLRLFLKIFGSLELFAVASFAVVFALGISFFANTATRSMTAATSIPAFLTGIVILSVVVERRKGALTRKKLFGSGGILLLALVALLARWDHITGQGVAAAFMAALSLVLSRTLQARCARLVSPLTISLFTHLAIGSVGVVFLANRMGSILSTSMGGVALLGGFLGALFQVTMITMLVRHGDLITNILIQVSQITFSQVTSLYSIR